MGYETYFHLRAENLNEKSRLRYRHEIKSALDAIAREQLHVAEFQAVIAQVNADNEAAAAAHSQVCLPAQAVLSTSDVAADRIAAHRTIADANTKLESTIQANKATIRAMQSEINKARLRTAEQSPLETALHNLASPGLQQRFAIVSDRLEWARKRFAQQRAGVELNRNRIASEQSHQYPDPRHIAAYKKQMTAHQECADDAKKQVADLDAELQQLRQAMLDE